MIAVYWHRCVWVWCVLQVSRTVSLVLLMLNASIVVRYVTGNVPILLICKNQGRNKLRLCKDQDADDDAVKCNEVLMILLRAMESEFELNATDQIKIIAAPCPKTQWTAVSSLIIYYFYSLP